LLVRSSSSRRPPFPYTTLFRSQQLVLINGGVSAGDADYVPQILQELGVEIVLHKVSIKPGKPLLVGLLPEGRMLFALPGNPLSRSESTRLNSSHVKISYAVFCL